METKMMIFTSPTCGACAKAKEQIKEFREKRTDFELIEIPLTTAQAQDIARQYGVEGVPTYIIQGQGYEGNIGLKGMQTEEVLNKYLDIAQGKRRVEDEGLFSKLLNWVRS